MMRIILVDDEGEIHSVDFMENFRQLLASEQHQFWVETGKLARFNKKAYEEWKEEKNDR